MFDFNLNQLRTCCSFRWFKAKYGSIHTRHRGRNKFTKI